MNDGPAESVDIDALMRLIRDEARRRNKPHGGEYAMPDREPDYAVAFVAPALFGDITYGKDSYTIAELTSSHGEPFVRNAYRALLRRGPDPEGLGHFLALLRAGRSKLAVLGGIRYSSEGRRVGVRVPGLYRRYLAERVFGIRIIGPIAESMAALIRIRSLLLHHRALEETSLSLAESVANASAQHSNVLAARVADTAKALAAQSERSNVVMGELRAELARQSHAMSRQSDAVTQSIRQLEIDLKSQGLVVQQASNDAHQQALRIDILANRVAAAEERTADLAGEHSVVAKRVDRLAADTGHRWPALQDAFYAEFEDTFRGTGPDIKDRVSVYLPLIRAAGVGTVAAPVIDLGCGRGEWLDVLRDDGLVGRGCDSNATFVDRCLKWALAVAHQDLFEYLQTLQDASVGAVTCFHVVEHLPFADVIHLLSEMMRVLRPAGLAIIETPNPENLRVGACDFYLDPTHRNPVPPAMLEYVVRSRGFADVEVIRLHPLAALVEEEEGAPRLVREVDALLQGPRDYSVIMRRPAA